MRKNAKMERIPHRPASMSQELLAADKKFQVISVISAVVFTVAAFFTVIWLTSDLSLLSEDSSSGSLDIRLFQERPPAPDFTLRNIDGGDVHLSDLKGKVLLVNFFATWCGPCHIEMPEMEALHQAFKNQGFQVLSISVDSTSAPLKAFAEEKRLTFPVLHDPGMSVARRYGFRGPPLTYLIDRRGRLVGAVAGSRRWNGSPARNFVTKLLAEPAA